MSAPATPTQPSPLVAAALLPATSPEPSPSSQLLQTLLRTDPTTWCKICTREHSTERHQQQHRWCPFCALKALAANPRATLRHATQRVYSSSDSLVAHLSACTPDSAACGPELYDIFDHWGVSWTGGGWSQRGVPPFRPRPPPPPPSLPLPPPPPPPLLPPPALADVPARAQPPTSGAGLPAQPPPSAPPRRTDAEVWLSGARWVGLGCKPEGANASCVWEASRVAHHEQVLQAIPPDVLGLWKHALEQWAIRWEVAAGPQSKLEALHMLLLAPSVALPKPHRGGRRSRDMRSRIHSWVRWVQADDSVAAAGQVEAVGERGARGRGARTAAARRYARAQWLVPKGKIGRAAMAIEALQPLSAADPAVLAQLHKTMPARDDTLHLPALPLGYQALPALSADDGDLRDKVDKCLARTSAAGPSGLEFAHLRVLTSSDAPDVRRAYAALLDLLHWVMCGSPCARASALLLSHRMHIIRKKEGSEAARAIVIGEVLVRTAALLLMQRVVLPARDLFRGIQYSVGEPGGSQVVSLILLTLLGCPPDHTPGGEGVIAVPIDISGAFYNVSRRICLERLFSLPTLAPIWPMVRWMLSTPAPVFVVEQGEVAAVARMTTGVGVGWVFGSLLFCLGTLQELQLIRQEFPRVLVKAVTDNITLVGPPQDTLAAADRLAQLLSMRGDLTLNPAHNKVLWLADGEIPPAVRAHEQERASVEIITSTEGVYSLLGVPVGRPEEVARAIQEDWQAGEVLREAVLDDALDPSTSWHINTAVVNARPSYLFRALHPDLSAPLAKALAGHQRKFLERRGGVPLHQQTESVLAQALLPLKDGGLGQPDSASLPSESFAAGFALAAPHLRALGTIWQPAVANSAWLCSALSATTAAAAQLQRTSRAYASLLPSNADLARTAGPSPARGWPFSLRRRLVPLQTLLPHHRSSLPSSRSPSRRRTWAPPLSRAGPTPTGPAPVMMACGPAFSGAPGASGRHPR